MILSILINVATPNDYITRMIPPISQDHPTPRACQGDMTCSHFMTWLIHILWHDSFVHVTWLVDTCDMTGWHGTWLVDMAHDSSRHVACVTCSIHTFIRHVTRINWCHTQHTYVTSHVWSHVTNLKCMKSCHKSEIWRRVTDWMSRLVNEQIRRMKRLEGWVD